MLEERKRRIGENEGIFRDVNEQVRRLDPTWMTILCECGEYGCREQLVIDPAERPIRRFADAAPSGGS